MPLDNCLVRAVGFPRLFGLPSTFKPARASITTSACFTLSTSPCLAACDYISIPRRLPSPSPRVGQLHVHCLITCCHPDLATASRCTRKLCATTVIRMGKSGRISMKIVTYKSSGGNARPGVVADGNIYDLSELGFKDTLSFILGGEEAVRNSRELTASRGSVTALAQARLLAPLTTPPRNATRLEGSRKRSAPTEGAKITTVSINTPITPSVRTMAVSTPSSASTTSARRRC